tara:strand:+ start:1999 stop:5007 length:3009 start_codon:yes stop_codon:yes gene_type:complete
MKFLIWPFFALLFLAIVPASSKSPGHEDKVLQIGAEISEIRQKLRVLESASYDQVSATWLEKDFKHIISKALIDPSKQELINEEQRYVYLVSRFGLERALDSLQAWLLINPDKYPDLKEMLSEERSLQKSVYSPWKGVESHKLKIYSSFLRHFPGLNDKLDNIQNSLSTASPAISRRIMAESMLLPALRLSDVVVAIEKEKKEYVRILKESLEPAKQYEDAYNLMKYPLLKRYKSYLDQVADILGCPADYSYHMPSVGAESEEILANADYTLAEQHFLKEQLQAVVNGQACYTDPVLQAKVEKTYKAFQDKDPSFSHRNYRKMHVALNMLQRISEVKLPLVNQRLDSLRRPFENFQDRKEEIESKLTNLNIVYKQIIYETPYLSVLLKPIEKDGQQYLLYEYISQKIREKTTLDNVQSITADISLFLEEQQDQMIQNTLDYMAYLASGDPKALAVLVEVRQNVLEHIKNIYPVQYEKWKRQDLKLTAKYGFNMNLENPHLSKFAEQTSMEFGSIIAVSLLAGQSKIISKKAIETIVGFNSFKELQHSKVHNLIEKRRVLLGQLDSEMKPGKKNLINKHLKVLDKLLRHRIRARFYGLSLLAPAAPAYLFALGIDAAYISHSYLKNKAYREFSRNLLELGTATGSLSYINSIHSHKYDDKDLIYTAAIQAATAMTFTHFSFLRGNGFAKVVNSTLNPKGKNLSLYLKNTSGLLHYTANTFNRSLVKAKEMPFKAGSSIHQTMSKFLNAVIYKRMPEGAEYLTRSGYLGSLASGHIIRPLYNVVGSASIAVIMDMLMRGYTNPIDLLKESETARLNLASFAIIDFILSYVSEGRSVTKAGAINFFTGAIGVGFAQYLVSPDREFEDYDFQRLLLEGAMIATYSTMKYKLFFKRFFLMMDTRHVRRAVSKPRRVADYLGLSLANNFIGNAPFLLVVFHLEDFDAMAEGKEKYFAERFYQEAAKLPDSGKILEAENLEEILHRANEINEKLDEEIDKINTLVPPAS